MATQRALLVVNRASRRGNTDLDEGLQILAAAGVAINRHDTNAAALDGLIRDHGPEADIVIVGGGDGTLHAAAPALRAVGRPVGIIPLGTANDLARTLDIPPDPIAACRIIVAGCHHRIDLGEVNGTYFFNVAHIGLSAGLTRQVPHANKRLWGVMAYMKHALGLARRMRSFRIWIRYDGVSENIRCIQLTVGNGRYYGGGMTVARQATIDDQLLHIYAVAPRGMGHLLRLAPALWRGTHSDQRGVWCRTARTVFVSTRRPMAVDADGELAAFTPARFNLIPRAVTVFIPKDYHSPGASE